MKEDEYPVRPGEKDCSFYLKTGRCDFGEFCRFNHPKEIPKELSLQKCKENATQMRHELGQSSEYPVRTGAGDCQYYLNGGCFFGRSCRYNHPPRNQMGDDTVQPSAYKERQARDLEEQKQREIVYENLRIDQIKATVQSDGGIQTEQRLELETRLFFTRRKADMEREKREAQEKAQEERSRSLTGNVDQLIQSLQVILGLKGKRAMGFKRTNQIVWDARNDLCWDDLGQAFRSFSLVTF
ncbi:hypothetical protein F2Q68_00035012 [Brassica cretica]|uniref:C3H1-type domain-containing protein n=1 Tax=Brassica cretica TaxID=69181 RepID=A0A8S9H5J5_BRACR|nr:hypothetical protein F2Q68_00035012 [Brassica cretica]